MGTAKTNITLLVFFVAQQFAFAENIISVDSLTYQEKLTSGDFLPNIKLVENDIIEFPLNFEIELDIIELKDLDIKSNYFFSRFDFFFYSKYDTLVVTKSKDSVYFYPSDYFQLIYPESDKKYISGNYYSGKSLFEKSNDSLIQWEGYVESEFPHKWDLRNYPFDDQNLRIVFESIVDTSYFELNESIHYPASINPENFKYLLDGFNVKKIITSKDFRETSEIGDYIGGKRKKIVEQLIFNIIIDRSGSYLFFKLFFGAFLSFLISYLVFFIEPKYFETRITLSLGGIFGAVGNKYFVENSMPAIQVLTKADLINNLVIIFIILNIFIVIAQHTSKISLWKFENNKFSSIFIFIFKS
jgi:hypothetical protein